MRPEHLAEGAPAARGGGVSLVLGAERPAAGGARAGLLVVAVGAHGAGGGGGWMERGKKVLTKFWNLNAAFDFLQGARDATPKKIMGGKKQGGIKSFN